MTKLSINLNKIALLRNSRGANFPKVTDFAELCARYGAHGVTVHPRPDQRHATYQDAHDLALFRDRHPHIELNVEGYPTARFIKAVKSAKPDQCTLVPDEPDQITSDHGWDTVSRGTYLAPIIEELRTQKIRTSIFLDPDPSLIESAAKTGADRIELYTEAYAKAHGTEREDEVFEQYRSTAQLAIANGLQVNAGHDLNQSNLAKFLTIPGIQEVSIGHALTVEALIDGYEKTVRAYVRLVDSA